MPVTITAGNGGKNPRLAFSAYRLGLPEAARDATEAAAKAMRHAIEAGAPSRLSGVGKAGARLTTRQYKAGSATQPQTVLKAVGPWQFIENNTKAHFIVAKSFGSRRARADIGAGLSVRAAGRRLSRGRKTRGDAFIGAQKAGAILTPRGPRVYARHPGTRGQHPWARGVERGTPAATLAFTKAMRADLRKQFG